MSSAILSMLICFALNFFCCLTSIGLIFFIFSKTSNNKNIKSCVKLIVLSVSLEYTE